MHWDHWPMIMKWLFNGPAVGAAIAGLFSARLWYLASLLPFPAFDPPIASIGDAPELHTMSTSNQLNQTVLALEASARLNARAARWTAIAAGLGGLAAILNIL